MTLSLVGARVRLRPWRDADLDPFARLSANADAMRHLTPLPDRAASDAAAGRMRAHFDQYGFGFMVVETLDEGTFAGLAGLAHVTFDAPFAPAVEIGWRLDPRFWGQGLAAEAARLALWDGFGRLNLDEIVAFTVPANERSWRLMERLGMTRDPADDFDHPRVPEGDPRRRHVLYRLARPADLTALRDGARIEAPGA